METNKTIISAEDFEQIAGELLGNGNMLRFRAHGRSMHPFIQDGDILTINPATAESLANGDIAFYRKATGQLTAHRILGKKKDGNSTIFLIRGDGHIGGPERVTAEQIVGVVIEVERDGANISINSFQKRAAAAIWSKSQSLRWILNRIRLRTTKIFKPNS